MVTETAVMQAPAAQGTGAMSPNFAPIPNGNGTFVLLSLLSLLEL
jgi:hypothetical protein